MTERAKPLNYKCTICGYEGEYLSVRAHIQRKADTKHSGIGYNAAPQHIECTDDRSLPEILKADYGGMERARRVAKGVPMNKAEAFQELVKSLENGEIQVVTVGDKEFLKHHTE